MAEHDGVDSSIHLLYKDLIGCFFVNNKLIANNSKRIENGIRFLSERLPPLTVRGRASTAKAVKSVETTFMIKWGRGRFNKSSDPELFFEENEKWVHTILQLPSSVTSGTKEQRDKKNFDQLSERQKNRRVEDLVQNEIGLLLLASAKVAKDAKEDDLEHVLRLLYKNRAMATKIRSLIMQEKHQSSKPKKLEPLRAVSFLLDNKLSKSQYIETRLLSMEQEANIFPAYNIIRETKKECRPPSDCFKLNDVSATLPFQELLDHTAKRLLQLQEPVIASIKNEGINSNKITVKLQVKWGSDGSSDHSRYNQKFADVKQAENSDGNLFATTMVPLQIKTLEDAKIIWNNTTPQSPRWCRPLRLHFAKEEDPFTTQELESVQREIDALNPFVITISDVIITVIYELYLTMIDGKMLAVVTKTKSKLACCICKATPKAFNNLTNIDKRFKPKPGTLNYGLSVLHLWIRCFEWLLHLSYRKDFEKWQRRGQLFKDLAANRKKELQKRFNERMNLRVDFPSTKGTGNSNNGNVCRAAFSKPEELSKILDLDEELVKRVRTILVALSCQLPLDPELFEEFCLETARFYVKRYFWYPMPSSVHKMLVHSRDIILANELPVGVLAEDAAESCNKMYRHNRQFHARKDSRKHNLQDIFNRALDTSDPIIASFELRKRQNSRIRKNLPVEVLRLLKAPEAPTTMETESEEVEEDSSDRNLEEFPEDFDGLTLPEDTHYSQYWDEGEDEDEDSGNENKTDSCSSASETNDTGDEDNRDFI